MVIHQLFSDRGMTAPGSGGSFLVSPWPQGMGGYGLLIRNMS